LAGMVHHFIAGLGVTYSSNTEKVVL